MFTRRARRLFPRGHVSRSGGLALVLALTIAATAVGACGDDDDGAPVASPARTATGVVPAATATATAAPVIVSPGALSAYRYAIALHVVGGAFDAGAGAAATETPTGLAGASFTIEIEGEVVNPDREHAQTKASLGFIELALERIQIGDRAWTREAGGDWKPATAGTPSPAIGGELDISPARIFAEDGSAFVALNNELRTLEFTADEVNGLSARRYSLDAPLFRAVFGGEQGLLPGDSRPLDTLGTLWIAEDSRVPLRIQLTSTDRDGTPAFEMDLTLTDLNARITIEPPL